MRKWNGPFNEIRFNLVLKALFLPILFGLLISACVTATNTTDPAAGRTNLGPAAPVPVLSIKHPFTEIEPSLPPHIIRTNQQKNPLLALGFLDVTLYGADPTGRTDSTKAIQNAMDDAYFFEYVCYFPSGTYLVSNTLCGMQRMWKSVNSDYGYWVAAHRKTHILMGEKGKRPVLRLSETAAGFGDPAHPKPLIQMWSQPQVPRNETPSTDIAKEQGNIQFDQKITGIDFDISGAGHTGAVAVRMDGAQGCSVEDVSINAAGAFTGFWNLPGPGGGIYNIEVKGGKHAIYVTKKEFCCIAGARFIGQTDLVIYDTDFFPLTLVGFYVEKESGPAFMPSPANPQWKRGGLSLIDGEIILIKTGTAISNRASNMLTVHNVSCRNADVLVAQDTTGDIRGSGKPGVWDMIDEYAGCWPGNPTAKNDVNAGSSNILIDGATGRENIARVSRDIAPPPSDIVRRHVWDAGAFPRFTDSDAVNVKTLGAFGDGVHDDTDALERAISLHNKIFLPRGIYLVRRTLHLKKTTQFFGASSTISIIQPDISAWKPTSEVSVIDTEDSADATTILANLNIRIPSGNGDYFYFNSLHWRAGRASIVRNVTFSVTGWLTPPVSHDFRLITIMGNGGGRWYGIYSDESQRNANHPDYRHLLVSGTHEPLYLYAPNIERAKGRAQSEIRNSSNVSMFLLKSEHNSTPLLISNSNAIRVYGYGGNACPLPGQALFEIIDSHNVLITNICPTNRDPNVHPYGTTSTIDPGSGINVDPATNFLVIEKFSGMDARLPKTNSISLFSRK